MLLFFLSEISKSWSGHCHGEWSIIEQRPTGNPLDGWRMKHGLPVIGDTGRNSLQSTVAWPQSSISSFGWGEALARFYKLEKQQEIGFHTYPQSGTQCGTGLTPSPSALVMLVDPPLPQKWSPHLFLWQTAIPNLLPPVYFSGLIFSLSQPHTLGSSWIRLLIPAQTHVLLFTPPASIHSIPASQYVHLSFSRNSDCWLHIPTFLRPNTMNLHPKNSGWVSHLHSWTAYRAATWGTGPECLGTPVDGSEAAGVEFKCGGEQLGTCQDRPAANGWWGAVLWSLNFTQKKMRSQQRVSSWRVIFMFQNTPLFTTREWSGIGEVEVRLAFQPSIALPPAACEPTERKTHVLIIAASIIPNVKHDT